MQHLQSLVTEEKGTRPNHEEAPLAALAAVAAVLYAPINLVYPSMGNLVITKAFVIIILGGMGSFPGAIVGGLIIGMAESFGGFYFSTDYKDIIAFVLLVVILSLRPQGLFTPKGAR